MKWAQTSDGFIARENYDSKWISNETARQLVHKWRSEEDAILIGSGTAMHDSPKLTVRDWTGGNPVRIVFDRSLKLPLTLHVFDGSAPTIIYNHHCTGVAGTIEYVQLPEEKFLIGVVNDLSQRKIQSVIVEGGAQVLMAFISSALWDEARIFTSPIIFSRGIAAPAIGGKLVSEDRVGSDLLQIYSQSH